MVQSAGHGFRLTSKVIKDEFNRVPVLHLLLRYTQALVTQMAQTAVCKRALRHTGSTAVRSATHRHRICDRRSFTSGQSPARCQDCQAVEQFTWARRTGDFTKRTT